MWSGAKFGSNTFERPRHATLHQRTGLFDVESQNPTYLAAPSLLGIFGETFSGFEADPVIIHAKKSSMGMRNIHGNQRNTCALDLVGNYRRDMLINLKFNDQVHPAVDKFIHVG